MAILIISTHPIQYHAPVYRCVQQKFKIPVTVVYGSDFSIMSHRDPQFGITINWGTDLLSGYSAIFLSRVSEGGARFAECVSAAGIRNILKKEKPEAVMILGYSHPFYTISLFTALSLGYPVLFRGEVMDHFERKGKLRNMLKDYFLRQLYGRCKGLLYIGQRSKEHFIRLGCPEEKLLFSPYCVDTASFQLCDESRKRLRSSFRAQHAIRDNDIVLLFSGKLISRKRPDLILYAAEKLPAEILERTVIVFLGDGEMKDMLESIAQRQGATRVKFIGFKNQLELSDCYQGADMLILPSQHSETWGLVVNEALHHGLPCVVSEAVGCGPDLIEPGVTGEIFKTGSVTGLTLAIQRVCRLIKKPSIREAIVAKVGMYSIEHAAQGIAQAYEFAVKKK